MPQQLSRFSAGMLAAIMLPLAAAGGCSSAHRDLGSNRATRTDSEQDAGTPAGPWKESVAGSAAKPATRVEIDETGPDNPAGVSTDEVKQLVAGGPPGKLRWLYPYDGTVFPRGTRSPALMWDGDPATDVVYLRFHSNTFDYRTIIRAELGSGRVLWTNPLQPQVRVPQQVWELAGQHSRGKSDPFSVELSTRVRGVIAGPVVAHLVIAPASIKGAVYYTSYMPSGLAASGVNQGYGSLYRIPPKGVAEVAIAGSASGTGSCGGCHSVAANGTRLLSQSENSVSVTAQAWSYPLDPATGALGQPSAATMYAPMAAFYPDGSKYLTGSLGSDPLTLMGRGNPLVLPTYALALLANNKVPREATLYDSATSQVVPNTGIPAGALMPTFSPDGTRLVFNDIAISRAHGLALMDYDTAEHKASRYRELTRDDPPAGTALPPDMPGWRPGWPIVTPDNQAVVFVRTDSLDFTSTSSMDFSGLTWAADATANRQTLPDYAKQRLKSSDLHMVDAGSGTVTVLAKAMGFDTPGDFTRNVTYLPFGDNDTHHNYYPTISPVAAGGYFWIFFDSVRNYGNLGIGRQLWGSAIDIRPNGGYTADPSHPPFYIEGQEFTTTNHRAFAALEVCKPNSATCSSGIDCCSGFCANDSCSPPPADGCAQRDERCASTSDCCISSDYCINGFCALVELL